MLLIGERISKYRKTMQMNQEEFAAKIGVSRQAVSKWETDRSYPDLDKLVDICKVFNISINELLYGTAPSSDEASANAASDNTTLVRQLRGKHNLVGLYVCTAIILAMLAFCCTVFVVLLTRNTWHKDEDMAKMARVERVYQQYTKADISFFDDASRKVQKTVWLDIDGIRDGDYVECFTDSGQTGIYVDYYMPTLIVPAALTLLLLLIFILLVIELVRKKRENYWHILVEREGEMIDEKE
ncbi:MAG: helix-turn-helix domain-containing protein [Clostridium sp.]|nr:helix-turn-helix domain-containing protein [Clostridium sp.]MCM1173278.1 helix-turn-helix domain-containing protein [Clostridium sp.]MCM1209491.1 helix-turn-helix domain-containing protein [Ruminococcus sp.]